MENLKIRVNSADESKEAQELFLKYGATGNICLDQSIRYVCTFNGILTQYDFLPSVEFKQTTLPELRAMVNPMKEYLEKQLDGTYALVLRGDLCKGDDIEVPEGAIRARFYPNDPDGLEFENAFCQWWHDENQDWFYYADYAVSAHHSCVVWQRATHPEELPFIDDEPKYTNDEVKYMDENGQGRLQSINDQYAEIEKVRQHNHYFKDVSSLNEIDVYMVLKLFNVTDPCLQHIAKKSLCAGQRGHKNFNRDLKDILDTAKRAVEINNG